MTYPYIVAFFFQHCSSREARALCQQICRALPWEMVSREGKAKDKSFRLGKWVLNSTVFDLDQVTSGEGTLKMSVLEEILHAKSSGKHFSPFQRENNQFRSITWYCSFSSITALLLLLMRLCCYYWKGYSGHADNNCGSLSVEGPCSLLCQLLSLHCCICQKNLTRAEDSKNWMYHDSLMCYAYLISYPVFQIINHVLQGLWRQLRLLSPLCLCLRCCWDGNMETVWMRRPRFTLSSGPTKPWQRRYRLSNMRFVKKINVEEITSRLRLLGSVLVPCFCAAGERDLQMAN